MKPKLSTRKPVDKITIADLEAFPIWEFALDEEGKPGQDETWIRPVKSKTVPAGAYSQLIRATFQSKSMRNFSGFMMVTTAKGVVEITPGSIITDHGYHFIPSPPDARFVRPELRAKFAKALGIESRGVFPMTYRLHVNIAGEDYPREGIIE